MSGIKEGGYFTWRRNKSQIMVCKLRFVIPTDKTASVKKRENQSANKLVIF